MTEYRFIEPVDVLYLRGNRIFGGAGDHSEALMPPWPSLVAGALRTRILVDQSVSFNGYAKGTRPPGPLGGVLGTPVEPGSFRVCCFMVGQRVGDKVSPYLQMPADLVVQGAPETCRYLTPTVISGVLKSSYCLSALPILRVDSPAKPKLGLWLNKEGLTSYLSGKALTKKQWRESKDLWGNEGRLGIAMDAASRTVEQGRLYTSDVVALKKDVGFIVGVQGADGFLPSSGLVRFGGDGRGATVEPCDPAMPEPPWEEIAGSRRFKLVLSTQGLFPRGWLPPGVQQTEDGCAWSYRGMSAKLVAASLGRPEVLSGWDMATDRPKPALRAVPAGSVYWFEDFQGEIGSLKALAYDGLCDHASGEISEQRKAEGFNNVFVAGWPQGN